MSQTVGKHAVVIGGSLAGMAQAAVLRQYFGRVTLLERDAIDLMQPVDRPGVPQIKQAHAVLRRGLENLEKFLPGLTAELIAAGVPEGEYGRHVLWFMNQTWWSQVPTGISALGFSRTLFEFFVRARLLQEKNIHLVDRATVTRFLTNSEKTQVTGIEFRKEDAVQSLAADLVVDCSGRFSKTEEWLAQIGVDKILREEVEVNLCYSTRMMRFSKKPDWKTLYVASHPPNKRHALLFPMEKEQHLLILGGYLNDKPPTDPAGVLAFLKTLASPVLADVYPHLKDVGEPMPYKHKSNLRRYFSRAKGMPDRVIFAGDVTCSLNPIYGQGITTATLGAELLGKKIQRRLKKNKSLDGLSREFQKAQEKILDQPWMLVLMNDLRYQEVQGPRTGSLRFMSFYMNGLLSAMHLDYVHRRMVPVFNMMVSPLSVFHPGLIVITLLAKVGLIRAQGQTPPLFATGPIQLEPRDHGHG